MQHIFNTKSLQAKYTEYQAYYVVFYNGNIMADICVSGQFIRFVNASNMIYKNVLPEISTLMDTITKQYKELNPENT